MGPGLSAEERTQRARESKDQVEVGNGKQVLELSFGPQGLIEAATARAVAVTTAVAAEVSAATTITGVEVSAEAAGATSEDVGRRLGLLAIKA